MVRLFTFIASLIAAVLLAACQHTPVTGSVNGPLSLPPPAEPPVVHSAWTMFAPGGVLARAVVNGSHCPTLTVDGASHEMKARSIPRSADFPNLVCEAQIPTGARSVAIADRQLANLPKHAKRVLILGDTGCRIKGQFIQACNDPAEWPFAQVAQTAASWKPDLVIHVGDYHYRESPCPEGNKACAGAHSGDTWASWAEDFFTPASPLLQAAPWVFVRGNHEDCERAGNGWRYLLELGTPGATCSNQAAPFVTAFDDHEIAILDSALDSGVIPSLEALPAKKTTYRWIAIHRPFVTPSADDESKSQAPSEKLIQKTQVDLVFAGHLHLMSLDRFKRGNRPPELIVGDGGANLDTHESISKLAGVTASQFRDFGFLTMEEKSPGLWEAVGHDRSGKTILTCKIREKKGQRARVDCPRTSS